MQACLCLLSCLATAMAMTMSMSSGSGGGGVRPSLAEIKRLPKIELHAHLSGCISQMKLTELLRRRGAADSFEPFDVRQVMAQHQDSAAALAKCFDYFEKVAQVVIDLATLKECTLHVLDSFAQETCLYLELRTSPKQLGDSSQGALQGKLEYLGTIAASIKDFQAYAQQRFGYVMDVGLLLSVDRGKTHCLQDALQQVDDVAALADAFPELVVGIDVCGNPARPSVVPHVIPALLQRKEICQRLPITFHTAEVHDDEESELIMQTMQDLNIRRLGHVCFFPESLRTKLLTGSVPVNVELCPTSNTVTKRLVNLEDHHFQHWWRKSEQVSVSICTDDTGLFSCSLSSELHDIAAAFDLSKADLVSLQQQALEASFHPNKAGLRARFDQMLASCQEKSLL